MLDFVYKLKKLLECQKITSSQSIKQLADITATSFPHTLQYMSEGLAKDIDVSHKFSLTEMFEALNLLSQKLSKEIEQREKYIKNRQKKAECAYQRLMTKISRMQMQKEWYISFKTMSYFAGQNQEDLTRDIFINLCSDIIRAGIKSDLSNIQELGIWLDRAVSLSISTNTREAIEDAIDLIETYGDFFMKEKSGKGRLILINTLSQIEEPACSKELWKDYKSCVQNFLVD